MLRHHGGEPDLMITCTYINYNYVNSVCTVKLYNNIDTAIIAVLNLIFYRFHVHAGVLGHILEMK